MKTTFRSIFYLVLFLALFACKKKQDELVSVPEPVSSGVDYTTPFDSVPMTSDIVMYEVNLRAFSASGDIQGVINRLDNLKSMHVNVIWLMPIYPIGAINSVNSPYSVKDYKAVNTELGTLEDLRTLVYEAHARNMAVVLDWVANHTAWDNAWINNVDWYSQDGAGNIIIPPGTNWADVADLNYDNTNMRAAMIDAMKYWIEQANVDGFRCDYADGVPFDFWQEAIDSLRTLPGRNLIFLAEGDRADHFTAGFDMTYAWDFFTAIKNVYAGQSAATLFTTNTSEYLVVPSGKRKLRYTTNHDESAWSATPMALFNGKSGATAASVVTTFMNGVPLIYTGQEVGRTSLTPFFSNSAINWSDNPDMQLNYKNFLTAYSQSEAARKGVLTAYNNPDIVCFKKSLNSEEVVVIANIRNTAANFSIPAALVNTTWTNAITNETVELTNSLPLTNYQYLILKN